MDDQQRLWNQTYQTNREPPADVSAFAYELAATLPGPCRLLELGCGPGADAALFATAGHTVTATDFAATAIDRNRARYADQPRLTFQVVDMREPLPFARASFDTVYARLSLHYFTDEVTRRLFAEIDRVLAPAGRLAFMCKSTADPLYGQGDQLEPDMFLLDGKVRHFFSEAYARDLLQAGWRIDHLWCGPETVYGGSSDVVKATVTKV